MNQNKKFLCIEDCEVIKQFNAKFNTKASKEFIDALNLFISNQSRLNEKVVKVFMLRWLISSDDILVFQSTIWDEFKKHAAKTAFDIEFDINIEDTFKESF